MGYSPMVDLPDRRAGFKQIPKGVQTQISVPIYVCCNPTVLCVMLMPPLLAKLVDKLANRIIVVLSFGSLAGRRTHVLGAAHGCSN